jgi:V8-like Glu-specific endopeptidase
MGSLLELEDYEVARRVARPTPPTVTPTIRRHRNLGYLQVYSTPRAARLQREFEEEVTLADDTRGFVKDTSATPYRFVCWLALTFVNPVDGTRITARGTGTLISPRHVLTAGHNLFNDVGWGTVDVTEVRVGPGFNCLEKRGDIFGIATSRATRVADRWRASADQEFDYGVITLRTPIGSSKPKALGGSTLGWWSGKESGDGTRINPVTLARLGGIHVNVSGYPGDKCCIAGADPDRLCRTPAEMGTPCREILWATAQFRAFGRVTNASPAAAPRLLLYDADTCGGHSGSPVWVHWQDPKSGIVYRNMVGIHTGPGWTVDASQRGVTNRAVRITDAVMTDVRSFMR